jgi:tetratricopeptide (TPR) repeat protein
VIAVVAVVAVAGYAVRHYIVTRATSCVAIFRKAPASVVVDVCRREYHETQDPVIGTYLADALRRDGDPDAATQIAHALLSSPVRADALQILGQIALGKARYDEAEHRLGDARQLHRELGNHAELARDTLVLAKVNIEREQYAEALQALAECIAEARAAPDERTEAFCHITAERALIWVGYFELASHEFELAEDQLHDPEDLAELWYARGKLELEMIRGRGRHAHSAQAEMAFKRSLEYAQRAEFTRRVLEIHLHLAFALAELGRTDEADHQLRDAAVLDHDDKHMVDRTQLAARVAYRRGDAALASSLNDQVFPKLDNDDERIDVCVMQARIALANQDFATAVTWGQRGVELAEKVVSAQTLTELRAWVLASRREPFEVLFTAYARTGRIADAIAVFDRWQGRALLNELARPSPEPAPGLAATATRIQALGRWLPAVSKAPLMSSDERAIGQALGKIDLLALVVADGDIWRLTARHGELRIDNLGAAEPLLDLADRFIAAPTAPAAARELGARLLPGAFVRKTDEPLYVVLDPLVPQLAALPVVALRGGELPIIASRPILRAPRLPTAEPCGPAPAITSAVVIADAADNLPDARRESSIVASRFGTTPRVGDAATSRALFLARPNQLLHVAVHARVDAGGGVLKLHDRAVSAAEISAYKLGPVCVVLSGCETGSSSDPELASSLATAFLAGGSANVVATLRSVIDAQALEVTRRFYEAGGADDPVGALARVQAALATTTNQAWPSFTVFTSRVCQ